MPPPLPPTHASASLLHASSTRFFSSRKPQRRQLLASNGHRGAMGKKHRGGSQQPQQAKQGKKKHQGKASTTTCSYVQVLSPGQDVYGGEAPASVLLFFDKRRYLFNCAEGFQRLCVEHKVRSKMYPISRALLHLPYAKWSCFCAGIDSNDPY